jgi:hypothetical protein
MGHVARHRVSWWVALIFGVAMTEASYAGTAGWVVQAGTISVVASTSGDAAAFTVFMPTGTFNNSACKSGGST